jgi:TRAP-type C4-dicarboxylate transport system permease small subunit
MFVEMVSPKAQKYWNAAANFVVVIIALVIAYIGFRLTGNYFLNHRVMQDVMDTPQWILLLPIPLGSFFLALQALLNGIDDLKCARSACPPEPPQPLEGAGL